MSISKTDEFPNNIRFHRKKLGFTATALAKAVSDSGFPMALSTLTKLETGDRTLKQDQLKAIADVLGIPQAELTDLTQDSTSFVKMAPVIAWGELTTFLAVGTSSENAMAVSVDADQVACVQLPESNGSTAFDPETMLIVDYTDRSEPIEGELYAGELIGSNSSSKKILRKGKGLMWEEVYPKAGDIQGLGVLKIVVLGRVLFSINPIASHLKEKYLTT